MIDLTVEEAVHLMKRPAKPAAGQTRLTEEEAKFVHDRAKSGAKPADIANDVRSKFGKTISPATISRYKSMEHFHLDQAGRSHTLSEELSAKLLLAFDRIRADGHPVCASMIAAAAIG